MKSALILDTPTNCGECNLCKSSSIGALMCIVNGSIISDPKIIDSDCKLVQVPQRAICNDYNFESYTNGLAKGINYVLDKLEGKNGEYDFADLIPTKEEK